MPPCGDPDTPGRGDVGTERPPVFRLRLDLLYLSESPQKRKNRPFRRTIFLLWRIPCSRHSKETAEKSVSLGYTNIVEYGGIIDQKGEIVSGEWPPRFYICTKEIKENGFGESKTQSEAFVRLHESLPTPRYTDVTSSRASFGVVRMSMALPSESKNHNITDGITSSPCFIVQPYNTMISSCTS